jgi:dihydropteroate synthase
MHIIPSRARLGNVDVGDGFPVVVMGVLNVSPESFYAGSVHLDADDLVRAADAMITAGARILDVGAMSTAPYLETRIGAAEEADRLSGAVARLTAKFTVALSADTTRSGPARAALEAGATIINDVSGLRGDQEMASLIAARAAGVILMASRLVTPRAGAPAAGTLERSPTAGTRERSPAVGSREGAPAVGTREGEPAAATMAGAPAVGTLEDAPAAMPIGTVASLLDDSLNRARRAGIPDERIVLDPGIGFFRSETISWAQWDAAVLAHLSDLRRLGRPLAVGVSRKSFIGAITGEADPAGRLAGSLAATAIAVRNGAALIRTHDVAPTRDAVLVASALRRQMIAERT